MDRVARSAYTFLFTDIQGSTTRWDRQPEAMAAATDRHDAILRAAVEAAGGQVYNTLGDAVFAVFDEVQGALRAALAAQQALAHEDWSAFGGTGFKLDVRMGIHSGEAEQRGGDFYGPALNRIARLTAAAHGGQILLSLAAREALGENLPTNCQLRDLGIHRLEDLYDPEHLFQALGPGMAAVMTPPDTAARLTETGPLAANRGPQGDRGPYLGLRAYAEADARFFYGREAPVGRLLGRVQAAPVTVVLGPSGSGKSSAVFAGLLPQWRALANSAATPAPCGGPILSFRPGRQPFLSLAAALLTALEGDGAAVPGLTGAVVATGPGELPLPERPPGAGTTQNRVERLARALRRGDLDLATVCAELGAGHPAARPPLLIADQFEELYSLCPDENERAAFQELLLAAPQADPAVAPRLVLTLRADFMGHALAYRPFADAVQGQMVVLGPLNPAELARVITRPAELLGCAFESGLVERIVDDVSGRRGTLPLLAFALAEMWARRQNGWLTHEAYETIGRVGGAIAQHAESVFRHLDGPQQAAARFVFLQLVKPGDGTQATRRLASREELGAQWSVVPTLADARLVVTDRDADGRETVDLVHEALIQSWQRLAEWLQADRRFREWQEDLRFARGQWEKAGQDAAVLLAGAPLTEAEEWLISRGEDLAPAERHFLLASLAERDRQVAEEEARRQSELAAANRAAAAEHQRAEAQATAARRLGLVSLGLVLATVVAAGFWHNAAQAGRLAQAQRLSAVARAVALEGQPRRALLLALEAWRRDPGLSPEASAAIEESLRFALARAQGQFLDAMPAAVTKTAVSPGGRWLATGDAAGNVRLAAIGGAGLPGDEHHVGALGAGLVGLAFDIHDARLFGLDQGGTLYVWDLVGDPDGSLARPSIAGPRVVDRLNGPVCALSVDPTGRWLAATGHNEEIRLWDLAAPGGLAIPPQRLLFTEGEEAICALAFTPAGDWLAAGDAENRIALRNLSGPQVRDQAIYLTLHDNDVSALAFSRDGRWLLSGGDDGNAFLIARSALAGSEPGSDLGPADFTPGALHHLPLHEDDVTSVVFSPDSRWFATADLAGTIRVWQIAEDGLIGPRMIERYRTAVDRLVATADSRQLLSMARDGAIGVWEMPPDPRRTRGYLLTGHDADVRAMAVGPRGDWLVSGDANGSVIHWILGPVGAGIEPLSLRGHSDRVVAIAVDPASRRVASASWDGTVKVWPLGGALAGPGPWPISLDDHDHRATAVAFAPPGLGDPSCTLFSGDGRGNVRLWRFCEPGRPPRATLLVTGIGDRVASLAVSPEGRWLVAGDGANRLFAWDMTSGPPPWRPIRLPHERGTPNVLRFLPGQDRFLAGVGDGWVEDWVLAPGEPRLAQSYLPPGGQGGVRALAYDGASQHFVAGSTAGQVHAWDVSAADGSATGLDWPGGRVRDLALIRGGRTVLAAGDLPSVLIWRDWTQTAVPEALFVAVEGVNGLALEPGESILAAAGADGTVYAWTRDRGGGFGRRIALTGHEMSVEGLLFATGVEDPGLRLISFDQAGELRVWVVNTDALIERACQAAGRNLGAEDEWPQYFPGEPWRPTCPELK